LHPSVERAHAVLSTTAQRWQQLSGTLSQELLARTPATGEWSALQCLQHLLDAEQHLFPVRLRILLAGENFSDFDPGQVTAAPPSQEPAQLAAVFRQTREESLALIERVRGEDLERTAQHPKLGTVTLVELLQTWAAHDLMHTVQAERALMQPLILSCGPWRSFFRDHDVALSETDA
jgi:uncharacterized damage-inducible protein DinB